MFHSFRSASRFLLAAGALTCAAAAGAQTLTVGAVGIPQGPIPTSGTQTVLQLGYAANIDGNAVFATFAWSAAPCPAAVKVKFFRPSSALPGGQFLFVDQRGPFDVNATVQTVRLDPPVAVRAGDVIALTNVTSCGLPVIAAATSPGAPGPYYSVQGDITANFAPATTVPQSGPAIIALATDESLSMLSNRFRLTLVATNPRTGAIAVGSPVPLGNGAGYFSLPDLTGDRFFPEVMVKMVDASGSPALGGTFWVFHSPLTDVQYTLTITDSVRGRTKSYNNAASAPGQLCGGVDTSAFRP
ncbi:MAG: hypothetical protein LC796_00015 [Acidobacteria bacterium]|nr:hypothetical protein [Acidobacteriota bacterium]MCA1612402.1 hypothetical protein [Acidobacteriota bacterium]